MKLLTTLQLIVLLQRLIKRQNMNFDIFHAVFFSIGSEVPTISKKRLYSLND